LALVVHIGDALMDNAVEMIGVGEGLVSEEVALEVTPAAGGSSGIFRGAPERQDPG
jgi:hypothetical protein